MMLALKSYEFCEDVQQHLLADISWRVRGMTVKLKLVAPSSFSRITSGERELFVPLLVAFSARTIISQALGVEIMAKLEDKNYFFTKSGKKKTKPNQTLCSEMLSKAFI